MSFRILEEFACRIQGWNFLRGRNIGEGQRINNVERMQNGGGRRTGNRTRFAQQGRKQRADAEEGRRRPPRERQMAGRRRKREDTRVRRKEVVGIKTEKGATGDLYGSTDAQLYLKLKKDASISYRG